MSYYLTIEDIKKSYVTLTLLAINIIAYIVVNVIMGSAYLFYVAQYNAGILDNGEWWRLFTAMFFHLNIQHIISNMVALLVVGSYCEREIPKRWMYITDYLISGLIGNLFTLALTDKFSFSLGASGAIAGLYGTVLVIRKINSDVLLIYTVIFLVNFFISSFAPGIGTWAHIFGLFSGILFGFIIKRQKADSIRVM